MNVLICEDEKPAQKHLSKIIKQIKEDVNIVDIVETGRDALNRIRKYDLDLIFMDIELGDGPCFETLDSITINVPIIFTTAYDEYALKAFKLNSIDYIVKPISKENVMNALNKFDLLKQSFQAGSGFIFSKEMIYTSNYKNRFLVKLGRKLFPLNSDDIAYFIAQDKMVFIITFDRKRYIINYTLSELEEMLDPEKFFRVNRQYIVNVNSIKEVEAYFKGQVTVNISPPVDEDIIVSRSKTPELKNWLGI